MNTFNLTLSGKHYICPSILNDNFAGQSILGCRSLPFMTSNPSLQPLLACKISLEKSADSLMATPLQVIVSLSLAAFKILSLSFILGNVIMMCLGVCFLGSNFFGTELPGVGGLFPLPHWGSSPSLLFQVNKFSISCFSCSPSGTPMIQMLECLKLSWRSLSLSFF